MDRDTVTQIKIGTHRFGIVDLKKVLKNMAETYADQIAEFKVKGTPALIINGKVMCSGKTPPKIEIIKWLKESGCCKNSGEIVDKPEPVFINL